MIQDRSNPGGVEMVVRGRWKLIDNDGGATELYDTRTDPDERYNLYFQRQGIALSLQHLLDVKRARVEMSAFE
jgi:arylsulfatase A-like enzyme